MQVGLVGLRLVKQEEIPSHEATHMCIFPWEYRFMLLPEGLPPENCTGGIIWGEVLHGISAGKLWEQTSSTALALPVPLGAGDIQDVPAESDIVTDMEKDSFLPLPSHAHGVTI